MIVDPKFVRPAEVDLLVRDSSKARKKLKWQPKVKFEDLIKIMVDSDIEGYKTPAYSLRNHEYPASLVSKMFSKLGFISN